MGTTTVHIPEPLLREIDRAAEAMGISRNRFVLQACKEALVRQGGAWPEGFFDQVLPEEDARALREATLEMERDVLSRRRNRGAIAL